MPTYHTDYLLGNDTTGNGSAALPWKTITRAYTSAVSDDIIKVAGSTISDVPGLTLTASNTSGTMTSNIDATGILAAGDVISLTHPQFGADKFFYRVHSVAGTTVVLNGGTNSGIAFPVRKFNQIHYATTTNTTFETPTSTGKDRIRVLGGWNSDFTLQNGWTVVRFQGAAAGTQSATFQSTAGGVNTYREKFCFVNLSTGYGGNTNNEFYGDMIGSRTGSMFGAIPRSETGYKPKWYMNFTNCQSGTSTIINADGSFALQLSELYNSITPENVNWSNCGFDVENIYVVNNFLSWSSSGVRVLSTSASAKIGNVNIYNTDGDGIRMNDGNGNIIWNGALNIYSNSATPTIQNPSLFVGASTQGSINWINTTQNVGQFRWWSSGNLQLWSYSILPISITDIEGSKIINAGGLISVDTTDYQTGSNSLKCARFGRGGGQSGKQRLAQFKVNNTTTSITITMTAKSTTSSTEAFSIRGFGVYRDLTLATRTIGTTWNTYTWTITNIGDIIPLRNNVCLLIWDNTNGLGNSFMWVDNVVITQS